MKNANENSKISADLIDYSLSNKYELEDSGFWMWAFEGIEPGESVLLDVQDLTYVPEEFKLYMNTIIDEFSNYIFDNSIEVINDIYNF